MRLSNSFFERLVSVRYSSSDNSRGSSKLNRFFSLYRIRTLSINPWTLLESHSSYRIENGLIKSIALLVNRWSVKWTGQHLAPLGIHTFLVNNTKSRSSEATVFESPAMSSRHTQQVLREYKKQFQKNSYFFLTHELMKSNSSANWLPFL